MQLRTSLVAGREPVNEFDTADGARSERLRRMTFDLVDEARRLATEVHASQLDKAGKPYIDHPRRVAERAASFGAEYAAVAWLHDALEDTAASAGELTDAGFPDAVVAGVLAMTKHDGEEHPAAVARACENDLARVVKAADVADNADPARLALIADSDLRTRLAAKYALAREVLDQHGAPKF